MLAVLTISDAFLFSFIALKRESTVFSKYMQRKYIFNVRHIILIINKHILR